MIYAAIVILTLSVLAFFFLNQKSSANQCLPPLKSGWIPWFGIALEFGKEPLHYIEKTRRELGDFFTIFAAGKRMTFICDHKFHDVFFHSQQASFGAAVQPYTQAAANITKSSFLSYHTLLHDTVKGKLTSSYSATMCSPLSKAFRKSILASLPNEEEELDLMSFVSKSMFTAVVCELFGKENLSLTDDEMLQMLNSFQQYDRDFEYGVELPSILVRNWSKRKYDLLNIFHDVVKRTNKNDTQPERLVEHLISNVDNENAPGYALLILWASQANAIPICFWTISFILSNPNVLLDIEKDLKAFPLDDITTDNFKPLSTIKRAMMESLRLRSPGMITRKLTESLTVKDFRIPAGDLLVLSPYWAHRDPSFFPEPNKFNPDRWLECDLDKGQFLPGFIPFGGGRYQCPGRWFALMEIHLYLAMVLKMVDITLVDSVPQPSPLHLVGSQQPLNPCRVKIKLKAI